MVVALSDALHPQTLSISVSIVFLKQVFVHEQILEPAHEVSILEIVGFLLNNLAEEFIMHIACLFDKLHSLLQLVYDKLVIIFIDSVWNFLEVLDFVELKS